MHFGIVRLDVPKTNKVVIENVLSVITPRMKATAITWTILGLLGVIGCKRDATPPSDKDLVGQWRLVSAGGKPSKNQHINFYHITFAADGTWRSAGQTDSGREGLNMQDGGNWTLNGRVINYTARNKTGASDVKVTKGHLTLDPDFILQDAGKNPLSGEYEK